MKNRLKQVVKIATFIMVGLFIFWLVYRDQDFNVLLNSVENANFYWLLLSLFLGILSHVSRAMRWNLLIRPMGYKPRLVNSFFSVMIMYLTNMAIPRSGEVVRCGVLSNYEKIPFTRLLGTVFIERIFDFLVLLLLLFIVVVTQFDVLASLLTNNPAIVDNVSKMIHSTPLLLIIGLFFIGIILVIYFNRKRLMQLNVYKKLEALFLNFISGVITIKNMENRGWFIAHSLFIWAMYFSMFYISFFAFPFTSHLSVLTGLTVFVVASFGMVAPSPGGMGTWHFMVIESLFVYGISRDPDGKAFALAVHGIQNLMLIILGIISYILLPIVNKNNTAEQASV